MSTESITGVFASERCRRGDWMIGALRDGTTVKGTAPAGSIRRGENYRWLGKWEEHPKFGKQFAFTGIIEERIPGKEGLIQYLLRYAPGIGSVLASRLYDAFEDKAVEQLRTDPDGTAEQIQGLSTIQAREAAEVLRAMAGKESTRVELVELLAGRGFPHELSEWLIEKYGVNAPRLIRRNPYLLMKFPGSGFSRADQLYIDLGGKPNRLKRQTLCIWKGLDADPDGHTWHKASVAGDILREKISGATVAPSRAIALGVRAKLLAQHGTTGAYIADGAKARNEATVAASVARIQQSENRWPQDFEYGADGQITEHQADQLYAATLGPIGLLIGSPGTGKTYTLAALIRRIQADVRNARGWDEIAGEINERINQQFELGRGYVDVEAIRRRVIRQYTPVYVCAPTGKAAVRATESLSRAGIELRAKTIHSTLGVEQGGGDVWRFHYNEKNPLPIGFLIVDESSMISCDLMASLLSACPQGMHVLLVGDPHQLPPVGHGAPLRDLIDAKLPVGELTEIRRNAGTIVRTCSEIKNGKRFEPAPRLKLPEANLVHLECKEPGQQIEALKTWLDDLKRRSEIDILRDVQVLCMLNKKSGVGRHELNAILQPLLNPNAVGLEGQKFSAGDKVICLKNSRLQALNKEGTEEPPDEGDDEPKHLVANGEIGFCLSAERSTAIIEFSAPMRRVLAKTVGEECVIDLGYAITTHRAQGSEWPIVLYMVDGSRGGTWVGCRELVYTAISRASRYCVTIGERRVVDRICTRVSLRVRKTFLSELTEEKLSSVLEGATI